MKRKVIFFYGINLLVTVILALIFGGVLGSIGGNEVILGLIVTMGVQLTPLISALIFNKRFKESFKGKCSFKFNKWILAAILIPVMLVFISSVIMDFMGIKYVPTGYKGIVLAVAVITTIIGCTAEEIGWRGCLLPVFEEGFSPVVSSVFTGLLWGLWHFFKISSVGISGFILFVPTIILFSVIMAYIFNHSGRSLVNMTAFHCFMNFSTIAFLYERECLQFYVVLFAVSLVMIGILWLMDRNYFKGR